MADKTKVHLRHSMCLGTILRYKTCTGKPTAKAKECVFLQETAYELLGSIIVIIQLAQKWCTARRSF
jgi:hypothetical protein